MNKKTLVSLLVCTVLVSGCSLIQRQNTSLSNQKAQPGSQKEMEQNDIAKNKKLDLQRQGLTELPSYVLERTDLEELDISHNRITGSLPAEIKNLKNLRILRASDNAMTGIPAELGQMQMLEVLDLSKNKLTGLPLELGYLSNLKTFNISGNDYSTFDMDIIKDGLSDTAEIIY